MSNIITNVIDMSRSEQEKKPRTNRTRWTWSATGAAFGLVGAILFPLFGALFIGSDEMLKDGGSHLGFFGNALMASTIPLLVCGFWCLDRAVGNSIPTNSPGLPVRPHPHLSAATRNFYFLPNSDARRSTALLADKHSVEADEQR